MSEFREIEKVCRKVADKAAICAELEEKEDTTPEEMEEAGEDLMRAIMCSFKRYSNKTEFGRRQM